MSSNAVKLNINTLETIENEFNIDFINEINTNRTVFEQETFEINETDIGFDENFESDSEFDSFESEDEEIPDNNNESDIIIKQKKSNNLMSCVLIDKIDGKIQRCKNKESFRTLWQLVGVWQIDNEGVSEEKVYKLRAMDNIYTCPALGECNLICKPVLKDTKYSHYICSECYELESGHFHVKPGKGKLLETCIDQKIKKVLGIFLPIYLQFLNANYLYEINTEIVFNQNQSITTSSNTSHNFFTPTLLKLPTFFIVRVLTRLNQIPIYPDEKELEDDDFEKLGKLAENKLWQSYKRLKTNKIYLQSPTNITEYIDAFPKFLKIFFEKMRPKLISSLHALLTKCSIIGHTSRHERRLEKVRMKDIDPTKRLIRGNNVFNLAIIDNIDFKEVTLNLSTLPILTNETPEPVRELNVNTQLFGMTSGMHTMQAKIDQTFEKFKCEFGCLIPPPNVVILTPTSSPNNDNEIFHATQMYKEEFLLNNDEEVNQITNLVISDFKASGEATEVRAKLETFMGYRLTALELMAKVTQGWHTSKDMLGVLLTIFSSYGIFHLATAIGVHFLDKLQAVVDYRSTRRLDR
ncbi:hypothetical protein RhiirC2_794577 [Rhizophagus irregularis]|uniref:Uncharacterized protein n=1 Tax=Rhizophagus irregularis TaxID=588596 RepID=A0A2N1MDA2_9GLOM|nr:hypothetical protein RhiirC2_794577 [Rhizophagus irregularis]